MMGNTGKAFNSGAAASAGQKAPYMARFWPVVFFVSMPGAFVAGFSGVKQIFLHIGAGEVLSVDSFTLSLLGLCGFTLLFDRFFCGRLRLRQLGRCRLGAFRADSEKAVPPQKAAPSARAGGAFGQKVKYLLLAWLEHLCDPAGKDADRRKPVGGVFPPDGSASAAGGLWCGHRAACAHFAGYGGAAPVLLSVPLPHGSGVCPAAGAAICAAAPAERRLHPGLQCL